MSTTTTTTPRLFLTDYASYNNGSQFEFGHWVDLDDFSDVDEFREYMNEHFKMADLKSPLDDYGSVREEPMFTDFEGFPRELYSESGGLDDLFKYLSVHDEYAKNVQFLIEQSFSIEDAIERCEEPVFYENGFDSNTKWELFEMHYPEADKMADTYQYLSIDYDAFIDNEFHEFKDEDGNNWYVSFEN